MDAREWFAPLYKLNHLRISNMVCSEYGKELALDFLFNNYHVYESDLPGIRWHWLDERGTLPKRIAQVLHNETGITDKTIPKKLGDLIRPHVPGLNTYHFEFTDKFNWTDGEFGDSGSCFWNEESYALDVLRTERCYAVLFYREGNRRNGYARAWIAFADKDKKHIRLRSGTSMYLHSPMAIIFNAYGMAGETIANVVAQYLKKEYALAKFTINDDTSGTVWINHNDTINGDGTHEERFGKGFVIGSKNVTSVIEKIDLLWDSANNQCDICGKERPPDAIRTFDGGKLCDACYEEYYAECSNCGKEFNVNFLTYRGYDKYCDVCMRKLGTKCIFCSRREIEPELTAGEFICHSCIYACSVCNTDKIIMYGLPHPRRCPTCHKITNRDIYVGFTQEKHKIVEV